MSLLNKAKQLRKDAAEETSSSGDDIVFDTSSGISEEDQRDILAQIDKVAQQNRISAAPETLAVKAQRKGVFFPVIVNIGAFLLLLTGFFTLSAFFRQSESDLRRETAAIRSAEGQLIQVIKRETEARIKEKEQEIDSIQARLREIDKERNDLQANMDARVQRKEDELRKALEAELAEERKRLTAQGLSEAVIAERMKRFEEEKTAQFNADLAVYKRQVEAERVAAEAALQKLQSDFQSNLASLNNEKNTILEDSRKREASLRAQLDERTRALESAQAKSQEQLSQAEAELRRLGEQRDRVALMETQILGFYTTVGNNLRAGNLTAARGSLESMKTFLNDPSIISMPGIGARRDVDIAAADAMIAMIDDNLRRQKEALSISQVLQTGSLVEEIRKAAAEADAARAAGNLPEAERLYTTALSRVPEVLASHEYFIKKRQAEDAARAKAWEDAIEKAEAAFAAGNYRESTDAYAEALAFIPYAPQERDGFIKNMQKSGYEILLAEQKQLESRSAPGLLGEGNAFLNQGRYQQAAAAYVTLLQRYPVSNQAAEAMEGIRKTVEAQSNLLENRGSTASTTIASLQAEKAAVEASLRNQNTSLRSEYEAKIAAMEAQIAELRRRPAVDAAMAPAQVIPPATQEELRRLAAVETEFQRVKSSYADYAAKEDGVLRSRGEAGIVEAKLILDTFLASQTIRTNFPGFDGRIKRYDKAFEAAGKNSALMEASDIAFRLSSYATKAEMDKYITAELARQKSDPAMKEYLETLQEFTR